MASSLPISRLVKVAVQLSPTAAQSQNLSTLLIMGSSDVIDATERRRSYNDLSAVAADFGTVAPEYLAAALYFEQSPQPGKLSIGRWIEAASAGGLVCGALSAAQQAIALWNAITTGAFAVTTDGGAPTQITGLNFTGAANLNAVAGIIDAAYAGGTVTWNATYGRFEFKSGTTGAASQVSFLSAPGAGVDISTMLKGKSTDGGYRYVGQVAETALAAVTLMDQQFGQSWYALTVADSSLTDNDHLGISSFLEGTNTKHIYGMTTQDSGVLVAATTTDIASLLKALGRKRTMVQYSSSNPYAVVSALARILTVDYNGNNTAITLMYKQEPGIVAESLNSTQMDGLLGKNANVFVNYNNDTAILQPGIMSSGLFTDIVTGSDWLAVTLQTALYNLLYTNPTKIPQTDAGTQLLVTTCESICSQGVVNGLLAPGVWQSGGFGLLKQNDFLPKGFYVYAPRVDSQTQADRAARKSVPIQIAAKLAGAIHEIGVTVTVNQ